MSYTQHRALRLLFQIVALTAVGLFAAPLRADDFGAWLGYDLQKPLHKKVDLAFHPEIRLRDDASEFHFLLLQTVATYHACPHLDLGLGYAFVRTLNSANSYITEHRELGIATVKATLAGLPLSWRSQMEVRQLHQVSDRYRGRVLLQSPSAYTRLKIRPYTSHEVFFDFRYNRINQDRTLAGFVIPVDLHTQLNLYYLRQGLLATSTNIWTHLSIIGSEFRVQFE